MDDLIRTIEDPKKAWMTSQILNDWLRKFELRMQREGRKVCLLLDNVGSHNLISDIRLKAVKVVFFPANCTSKLQPMYMGAIRSETLDYESRILKKLIECLDRNVDFKIDILTAIMPLSNAWQSVSGTVLQSSFRKAKLVGTQEDIQMDEDEVFWDERFGNGISFEDYLEAENNVLTYEPMSDAGIVEEAVGNMASCDNASSDGEEDPVIEREVISAQQALDKIEELKYFIMRQKVPAADQFKSLECLENWLQNERANNKVQRKITNFFKPWAEDAEQPNSISTTLTVGLVEEEAVTDFAMQAMQDDTNDKMEDMSGSCVGNIVDDCSNDDDSVHSEPIG